MTARNEAALPGALPDATGPSTDLHLAALTLSVLFALGAVLSLGIMLLLPVPAGANEVGMVMAVINALLLAGGLFWYREHVNPVALNLATAWGTTLVTAVAYLSTERPSPFIFLYLWVVLYSASFFSRSQVAAQLGLVAVAYGSLLLARVPDSGGVLAWWVCGTITLVVGALLIATTRGRIEQLIARLCDAARTDPLTGLNNRFGFREALDLEVERVRRSNGKLAIVSADVDGLQELNERAGRHAGDATLRRIARVIGTVKRQSDVAARVAGGEFALVLPDTDSEGALGFVERVRKAIDAEFSADLMTVGVSFGVASQPTHGQTAASLIRACDEAVAAAKNDGGNRAILHHPELRGLHRKRDGTDVEVDRYIAVMLDLAETVDLRFSGNARHSETVGRYAEMMARELGLPASRVERVRLAGMLHDVGKVAVPDSILHKPAKLSDDEFTTIKRHPELGAQIIEHPSLADISEWVGTHHERPDGRGYPHGLTAAQIAIEAQIIAVADAYEAMTSDRAYRGSIGQEAARAELRRCAGSQFDPRVVNAFVNLLERDGSMRSPEPVPQAA
jgi:diguanylate cyclase (GGDEF)-like protein/putative nucleotidyltransferase with HDIG domain